jgi:organic radical activating enzyme
MEMSPKEVAECIRRVGTGVRRVVFTGGEPTIQQRSIIQVMDDIWASELDEEADWQFEIETNGTISLEYALAKELDNINCSPKMANSGNSLANRFKPEVIKDLMLCREKFGLELIFKFVVGKESAGKDLKEIRKWQIDCKVPSELIYLMPEGITADKITEGTRKLFEVAREHGYKLSTRLHILLWGNKRAV